MLLHHFDPTKKTFIHVDAHINGLSATLLQGDSLLSAKTISFASRATTNVEKRYPQLDLEALAIDFGLRRFRHYIMGGPAIDVTTDHKPLVSIFSNTRIGSIRTDRIKLRHQDIQYNVIWQPGSTNPSDFLSRHATPLSELPKSIQKESSEFEKTVWFLQYSPYTEAISMTKIIKETAKDPTLLQLKECTLQQYIPTTKKPPL